MKKDNKRQLPIKQCLVIRILHPIMGGDYQKAISAIFAAGITVFIACSTELVSAAPQGGVVTAGQGNIQQADQSTLINQQSESLVVNWDSFNVSLNETVRFDQPSSSATALNLIGGQTPSEIFGNIDANGRVFLVNPNGIIFGQSSMVNVASLLATGLSMDPDRFMQGDYSLFTDTADTAGIVVNRGLLQAASGGSINLVGGAVINEGLIVANFGQVNLGSGRSAVLDFDGDGLIGFAISDNITENLQQFESGVSNSGQINADGGQVLMTASVAQDVFTYAVNNSGVIRANRIDRSGGEVRLVGSGAPVVTSGNGQIDVSGVANSDGGSVHMLADQVGLLDNASIDASGSSGGGTVLIGGDYRGGGDLKSAEVTYMGANTSINADAKDSGNGGKVILWANDTARVYGEISAVGGASSGDGGFIETSGKMYLDFQGYVNATSANGSAGTWLLDPQDILISTAADANITQTPAGTFSPTSANTTTTLDVATINGVLDAGTSVIVQTVVSGGGANTGNITVDGEISKTNDGNVTLTLLADDNIALNANVTDISSLGTLGVDLQANGEVSFGAPTVTISTNGGDFSSSGTAFNAGGQAATINTAGGAVTLNHTGAVNLTNVVANSLNVTAGSAITQVGTLDISAATTLAAGAGNDITLTNANTFSNVSIASGNNVSLVDADAIELGTSTVSGTLDVSSTGAITQNGALDVSGATTLTAAGAGNDITLESSNTFSNVSIASANNVSIVDANAIELGASTVSGTLNISSNGAITQNGVLDVNGATTLAAGVTNNITLDDIANDFSNVTVASGNNVLLTDANAIELGASTVAGTLDVTSNGAITQNGVLDVSGATTLAAGVANNITLTSANFFSNVSVSSGNNVSITDANTIELGASTVNGALNVSSNGAITQNGIVSVSGVTTLAAGAANDITLDSANTFSVVDITSANNVSLTDANTIQLGASTVAGTLDVTSNGAITQNGVLDVSGATTLAAGASNDITLDSANTFANVSIVSANNVSITDSNAIELGTSTVSGTLTVSTSGAITQNGALNVSGVTTLAAGAANDITLTSANDFSNVSISSGNNVSLTDANVIALGASTVSGTLDVSSNGAITQNGVLNVSGATTLTAGAANDITLTSANDFSNVSIISANNASLTDNNTIELGASTVSGTLDVSSNGAITQNGVLNVSGATTLTAGAANDITLNSANTFSNVSVDSANNVSLTDSNAIELGASTVSGTLNVSSNGTITQNGVLNVSGATTLAAGAANDIILTGSNAFSSVSIGSGNNVSLTDASALELGTTNISGTLNVSTSGDILQTTNAALNVVGASTFTINGANTNIDLFNSNNVFGGGTTFSLTTGSVNDFALYDHVALVLPALPSPSGSVKLDFASAVDLPNLTLSGGLTVVSGGEITQNGSLIIGGVSSFTAGPASDVTLADLANDFKATVNSDANIVSLADANDLELGATTAAATLNVTTNGDIIQTGAANVGGVSTFTINGANSNIDLFNSGNVFGGGTVYTLGTGSVNDFALYDHVALALPVLPSPSGTVRLDFASSVALPDLMLSGDLWVTSGGEIFQTGELTINGLTTLAADPASDITLANTSNDFSVITLLSGNDATLRDRNSLVLSGTNITGKLDVIDELVVKNVNRGQSATFGFTDNFIDPSLFDLSISFVEIIGDGVKLLEEEDSDENPQQQ